MFYKKYGKRILDILISLSGCILLSPVFLVLCILVRLKLGSPIFFCQERPGYQEKIFRMYKFRTMTDEKDEHGNLLPDEKRLNAFGKKLRATSLDELPELFNILKGDLSLVGPRPLLVRYLPRYNQQQRKRHNVKPGLTGYAQVHGRNAISWEEKFEMDVWYAEHVSFLLDVKIFFQTIFVVAGKKGVNSETSATMEEFMGSELQVEEENGKI